MISFTSAANILKRIRSHANDVYSTTASHFLHAGDIGVIHFYSLLNEFIRDVRKTTIEEVNPIVYPSAATNNNLFGRMQSIQ